MLNYLAIFKIIQHICTHTYIPFALKSPEGRPKLRKFLTGNEHIKQKYQWKFEMHWTVSVTFKIFRVRFFPATSMASASLMDFEGAAYVKQIRHFFLGVYQLLGPCGWTCSINKVFRRGFGQPRRIRLTMKVAAVGSAGGALGLIRTIHRHGRFTTASNE